MAFSRGSSRPRDRTRISCVSLYRSLSRVQSCIWSIWSQCHITLSRLCPWNGSTKGTVGRMCLSRKGVGARRFLLPRSSFWVSQQSCSMDELLQQLKLKMFSFFHIWFVFVVSTLCFDYSLLYFVNPKGNQPWIFIGRTDAEGHWKRS